MAISSLVVKPVKEENLLPLASKLETLEGVEVAGVSQQGIALVLEAENMETLKEKTEKIQNLEEVLMLQIAYVNWHEETSFSSEEVSLHEKTIIY
ncbi:MAG: nitrate reductase [Planctomycetota bacterium]|nr:MAG: nitrate reductase [Planctomycetota bacterium]